MATMSPWRAWLALIGLSLRRQARARQMLWVAFGLLLLAVIIVASISLRSGWSTAASRFTYRPATKGRSPFEKRPPGPPPILIRTTYGEVAQQLSGIAATTQDPSAVAIDSAVAGAMQANLERSRVVNFTRGIMFSLFIGFLLPVWCLSFATEALGGELESKSIVWLLTRPLPRWSIFVAKYVAMLPWALAFSVGGFWLMCQAGGPPGREAFAIFWPAVVGGTMAFTSLFHFFSAATRRPTVVGLVYCFFLETLLGDMPGLMKRMSISFYVRCLIFDRASQFGIQPDKPSVYWPVSAPVAWGVLIGVTVGALALGAYLFSRSEYRDDQ